MPNGKAETWLGLRLIGVSYVGAASRRDSGPTTRIQRISRRDAAPTILRRVEAERVRATTVVRVDTPRVVTAAAVVIDVFLRVGTQ